MQVVPPSRNPKAFSTLKCDAAQFCRGQALAVAEASLRLGAFSSAHSEVLKIRTAWKMSKRLSRVLEAQCKLQHGPGKWLNAVVVETLPNSKVRVHVPCLQEKRSVPNGQAALI